MGASGDWSGPLLMFLMASCFPRLGTSMRMRRLPSFGSTGCNMRKSDKNLTNPSESVGASSRSAMVSLAAFLGSTAKWNTPSNCS